MTVFAGISGDPMERGIRLWCGCAGGKHGGRLFGPFFDLSSPGSGRYPGHAGERPRARARGRELAEKTHLLERLKSAKLNSCPLGLLGYKENVG
jgi:hypothetical protein